MRTRVRAAAVLLLTVAFAPGCQDDSSPLDSVTTPATSTAPSSNPAGSDSDGATTDDPTTSAGSGTDTGGSNPREICERYLACIATVSPGGLPEAQMGFGENGSCWQGSEAEAQLCLDACQAGLEMYNQQFPEETACGLCQAHADCDMAVGELCHLGQCTVTTCSDGIVDVDEVCDSQLDCDADCLGPQECNPLSHYPCPAGEGCYLTYAPNLDPAIEVSCIDRPQGAGVGSSCGSGPGGACDRGLACVAKEFDPACETFPEDEGCCQPLCDLGAPDVCEAGRTCVPYQDLLSSLELLPELGFLGFCVPS